MFSRKYHVRSIEDQIVHKLAYHASREYIVHITFQFREHAYNWCLHTSLWKLGDMCFPHSVLEPINLVSYTLSPFVTDCSG